MKKTKLALAAGTVVLAITGLSACASTSDDRSGSAGGSNPDNYSDATHVTLYRNVDNVPNVATFCAGTLGFASTLSSDGAKNPTLVRVPEMDSTVCGATAR